MVVIEDAPTRMDTVCAPLKYQPGASVTEVVCTSTFPPMVGVAGLASSFAGFGPPRGAGDASPSSSSFPDSAPPLVRRISLTPDAPIRGAFQHCALFKNILVAADGDASARLRVVDVRDWTEKQTIRVGAVSERGADAADVDADDETHARTIPAAVSALAFDGTTIVAATHEGFVHTWRLMARGPKRGYVRLLQPLRVDGVPVTRAKILGEPGSKLLACHAPSKRAFVVWELDTGKLRGAFSTDGVARGVPLRLVESCATVLACVHADAAAADDDEGAPSPRSRDAKKEPPRAPVAALLDVRTGEGGALRDSAALWHKGTPTCAAFDGELFVVATSLGVVVAWDLGTGDAPATSAHAAAGARVAVAAVALVPGPASDGSARALSGGADRALVLWDKALRPLARLEVGSPVTCLAAPGPRLAVAGTQDGFVEVVALPAPERDEAPDAALAEERRATRDSASSTSAAGSRPLRYALQHDPGSAASAYASFDAFTRRVPVWEGAYVAPSGEAAGSDAPSETGGSRREKNASGFSPSRALAGSGRTRSEEAARREAEEEEGRAKQRAMDGAGVARNPNVRATADGSRKCSNPTCVAREDTLAPGQKMLRCSRCKSAFYCSTHCQRTHWRDGHRRECVAPLSATRGAPATETEGATGREASPPNETRPPAPARRALVVESESDEDESDDASDDASDSEAEADVVARERDVVGVAEERTVRCLTDETQTAGLTEKKTDAALTTEAMGDVLLDDAAPALPPWMTAHAPPGVSRDAAGPKRVFVATEAPPAVRTMAVENAVVESREAPAAGLEAEAGLEPLDEHDLLYELD